MNGNAYHPDEFQRVAGLIEQAMGDGLPIEQSAVYGALVGHGVSQRAFLSTWLRLSMRGRIRIIGRPGPRGGGLWELR